MFDIIEPPQAISSPFPNLKSLNTATCQGHLWALASWPPTIRPVRLTYFAFLFSPPPTFFSSPWYPIITSSCIFPFPNYQFGHPSRSPAFPCPILKVAFHSDLPVAPELHYEEVPREAITNKRVALQKIALDIINRQFFLLSLCISIIRNELFGVNFINTSILNNVINDM